LGLEQSADLLVFHIIFNAFFKDLAGEIIVYVVILIYTSIAVLAQEIVVLFGLNVQNHPAVEHNIRKLQHLLYIKRGIRTKKALSV
jgi:hypothetical protein